MTRSPREKFQANIAQRDAFGQIVTSPAFEAATDAALLQMQMDMPDPADMAKGWDAHSQMSGAKRFLAILSTIHHPIATPKSRKSPSLNYEAGV
jgi:hypothetical protein